MFLENKYSRWYNKIIQYRLKNQPEGYVEKHHIIPRCLGGLDTKNNIVRLTAREHFICHRLLVYMTEGTNQYKMKNAVAKFMCCAKTQQRNLTSRQYALCREFAAETACYFQTGRKRTKESIQKGLITCKKKFGSFSARKGIKLSDEGKQKIANKRKLRPTYETWFKNSDPVAIKQKHSQWAKQHSNFIYNNPSLTDEGKRKISLSKSTYTINTPFGIFTCRYDFDLHPICNKIGFENIFHIKDGIKNKVKTRAINRANLPIEWVGKTWEELGFSLLPR